MAESRVNRKLAAILSADVVGYSRLMADDEAATVDTLKQYRAAVERVINQHDGRIVNAPGDNMLAEFPSAVEAVQAAVEIQRNIEGRNAELPEERRMHFRVGLNLGDVIEEDDGTIYGDGVNIAARMEALAEEGGVCISSTIYDAVEGKLDFGFDFLGEQQVKNIGKPVRVYRVRAEPGAKPKKQQSGKSKKLAKVAATGVLVVALAGVLIWQLGRGPASEETETAATDDPVLAMPTGPSIAVLPFTNLSGDPEQEYFSDGLTDTLITSLSKLRDIVVMARNSTFIYKDRTVDIRQVGRELGVRYVLEGSVQKADGRIRVNVQLVDAKTGAHLWAEIYDREFKEIFAVQDEITQKIAVELDVTLVAGEEARSWRRSTENPNAYDLFLRGWEARTRSTKEDSARARRLFEQALELDPEFTAALFGLGTTYFEDAYSGWSDSPSESYEKAIALAEQAIALDPNFGGSYDLLGELLVQYRGEHEKGLENMMHAVALEPNSARYNWHVGGYLCPLDRAEEGLEYINRAFRLSPHPPGFFDAGYGICYLMLGRFEESIASNKKSIARLPDFIWPNIELTVAYMELGRVDEAQAHAKEVLRINPKFSVEDNPFITCLINPETRKRFKKLLRQGGLP
jgi:adenylate cyclase